MEGNEQPKVILSDYVFRNQLERVHKKYNEISTLGKMLMGEELFSSAPSPVEDYCAAYVFLLVIKHAKKTHGAPIIAFLGLAKRYRGLTITEQMKLCCKELSIHPEKGKYYESLTRMLKSPWLDSFCESVSKLWCQELRNDLYAQTKANFRAIMQKIEKMDVSDNFESVFDEEPQKQTSSVISFADLIQLFAKSPSEAAHQPLDREGNHYPSTKVVVDMIEGYCQEQEATEDTDATLETHISQRQQIYENEIEFMNRYRVGDDCIGAVQRFLLAECYRFHDDERAREVFDGAFYLARNILNGFIEKNVFTEQMTRYFDQVLNVFCSVYRDKAQTENLDFIMKHFSLVAKAISKAALQFATDGRSFEDVRTLWDYYCETGKFVADLTERAFLSGIRMPVISDGKLLPAGEMHYTIFYPYPFHDNPHLLPHDWFHLKFVSKPEMFRRSLSYVPSYYFKEYLRMTPRPELLDGFKMLIAEKETFKQFLSYAVQNQIQIDGLISLPEKYTDKESICGLIDEVIEGQGDYTAKSLLEEMKCYVLSENRLPFAPPDNEDE